MSEQFFRWLNGALLVGGGLVLWRQLGWQLLIGLWGEQRRSAFAMVLFTSLAAIQYGLAVLDFSPPFALNERGTVTFFLWIGAIYWWGSATQRQNKETLDHIGRKVNWWRVAASIFKRETWTRSYPPTAQFPGDASVTIPNKSKESEERP